MREILIGPPGTGKTTSLLRIVEDELHSGTDPRCIGLVTFTQRAANEAITRACKQFNLERDALPHFRTLHSMCFRWLGMRSSGVLGKEQTKQFAEYAGIELSGFVSDDGTMAGSKVGDRILFMENLARTRCVDLREQFDHYDDDLPWAEVQRVSDALVKFKEETGLTDFTDMLSKFLGIGGRPQLDVLIGDEVQDQTRLQWKVFDRLAIGCRRVIVAGDDQQAIFHWCGADVDRFVNMEGDTKVLGQSYRVPRSIQKLSALTLKDVKNTRERSWAPRDEEGTIDRTKVFDQCDLSGDDVLVLARNVYLLREQIEPELMRRGIVFENQRGHSSVKGATLRAIVAWEKLRKGEGVPLDDALSIYDQMSSGKGVARGHKKLPDLAPRSSENPELDNMVTMGDLRERGGLLTDAVWYDALDRITPGEREYLLAARRAGEKLSAKPRVRTSTIHGAKGGEAEHVILLLEMAWRSYRDMTDMPDGREDEGRVWFVGVSRARTRLTLVESGTQNRCPWL